MVFRSTTAAVALVLVAFISLPSVAEANRPLCLGYKNTTLDFDCRKRTTETACLKGYSMKTADISASCIWHHMKLDVIVDSQMIYNRGGMVELSGLVNQGSLCSNKIDVVLPAGATGKWGTNTRVVNGPQDILPPVARYFSPKIEMTTAGCTAGLGLPNTCGANLVTPQGYAHDPNFFESRAFIEFQTIDAARITYWKTNNRFNAAKQLAFKILASARRCYKPPYPAETPVIKDQIAFGPTPFIVHYDTPFYTLLDIRAYRLTNLSGAAWTVAVSTNLEPKKAKTNMTSFLMRESEYVAWLPTCKTTCALPVDKAFKNTLCKGLLCTKGFRGLGASGAYRLIVAYPTVYNPTKGLNSNWKAPASSYTKQIVTTTVWPKNWKLAPPQDIFGGARSAVADADQMLITKPPKSHPATAYAV